MCGNIILTAKFDICTNHRQTSSSFLSTDTLRARCIWCSFHNKTTKMSSHLNWMIIRNNNAFLVKKRNIAKPFSKEPNNVTNLNSYRYNGLIQKKAVGVVENPDRKGFTVVYKKAKATNKPVKNTVRRTFKAGARRSLYKVKRLLKANHYRTDLSKATLRRASAILRSQRPIKAKKPKAAAAKAE